MNDSYYLQSPPAIPKLVSEPRLRAASKQLFDQLCKNILPEWMEELMVPFKEWYLKGDSSYFEDLFSNHKRHWRFWWLCFWKHFSLFSKKRSWLCRTCVFFRLEWRVFSIFPLIKKLLDVFWCLTELVFRRIYFNFKMVFYVTNSVCNEISYSWMTV
jgi:hypothetical protein